MRRRSDVLGRLYAIAHEVNERHFGGLLPTLPIHIRPVAKRNGKVESVAFLWVEDGTGAPRYIVIGERLALDGSWTDVRDALKHELVHVWQAQSGGPVNHGPTFRQWCQKLGISMRAVD